MAPTLTQKQEAASGDHKKPKSSVSKPKPKPPFNPFPPSARKARQLGRKSDMFRDDRSYSVLPSYQKPLPPEQYRLETIREEPDTGSRAKEKVILPLQYTALIGLLNEQDWHRHNPGDIVEGDIEIYFSKKKNDATNMGGGNMWVFLSDDNTVNIQKLQQNQIGYVYSPSLAMEFLVQGQEFSLFFRESGNRIRYKGFYKMAPEESDWELLDETTQDCIVKITKTLQPERSDLEIRGDYASGRSGFYAFMLKWIETDWDFYDTLVNKEATAFWQPKDFKKCHDSKSKNLSVCYMTPPPESPKSPKKHHGIVDSAKLLASPSKGYCVQNLRTRTRLP